MINDPDLWRTVNVHWHGYVEISSGDPFEKISTRDERLEKPPDVALMSPDDVAQWLADMTRKHAHPEVVHLIGPGGGTGMIGDDGHINHDMIENFDVLCRGDSVYYDFRRQDDRMRLWAEAVTDNECREVHTDEQES